MSSLNDIVKHVFEKELSDKGVNEKLVEAYSVVYTNIFIDNIQELCLYCVNYSYYKEQQDRDPNYNMLDYNDFSFSEHDKLMSKFPDIPNTNDVNIFLMELSEMKEVQEYVNTLPPMKCSSDLWDYADSLLCD